MLIILTPLIFKRIFAIEPPLVIFKGLHPVRGCETWEELVKEIRLRASLDGTDLLLNGYVDIRAIDGSAFAL